MAQNKMELFNQGQRRAHEHKRTLDFISICPAVNRAREVLEKRANPERYMYWVGYVSGLTEMDAATIMELHPTYAKTAGERG